MGDHGQMRSPQGCPGTANRTTALFAFHAVEEVYELIDAIESGDDHEMAEELGDLLMQVVFHCQLARERGAFDFEPWRGASRTSCCAAIRMFSAMSR
jgi:NTP pyrophosphatase (non-canonical NTP hydrolase)